MKAAIREQLLALCPELGVLETIEIYVPKAKAHGDFSTNAVLKAAKVLGRKPMELAMEWASSMKANWTEVEDVKAVPPGFINFYMGDRWLYGILDKSPSETMTEEREEKLKHILAKGENRQEIRALLPQEEVQRLQYVHSRISSVTRILINEGAYKAEKETLLPAYSYGTLEKEILKMLWNYEGIIHESLKEEGVHSLLSYLQRLGNLFYSYHEGILFRSLSPEDLYGTLQVMGAIKEIVGQLLRLLNVPAPEKM